MRVIGYGAIKTAIFGSEIDIVGHSYKTSRMLRLGQLNTYVIIETDILNF